MSTPFEIIKSISETKKNLLVDAESEKDYNPFMVNRGLSYFSDTIMYANEMNRNYDLPKKMQHDFLFYAIPKKKRFSKWVKKEADDKSLSLIKEYFKYSNEHAKSALKILTPDQLKIIEVRMYRGGR